MTEQENQRLRQVLRDVAAKIRRYQGKSIGEQNTKASLIDPVLEALGWDIRDFDEVHREYKAKPQDRPVDYALKMLRQARLFLEAKGLDENLADRKWVSQILGYATVAGVAWCVLSDGDHYRFYNATAAVDAEDKLFCEVRISEASEDDACRILQLISRSNMEENLLDAYWNAHFVDRRVKEALRGLLDARDKSLIRLLRHKTPELSPKDISDSLMRFDIHIDAPAAGRVPARPARRTVSPTDAQPAPERKRRQQKGRTDLHVSLSDVIGAGLLSPPVKLFRRYKKTMLEATLLADGRVEFQGKTYGSSSEAAGIARGTITGRPMNTNGWTFWQYRDEADKVRELAYARQLCLDKQG
jgi:predicted type IV restriction endonuclease